jgi:hypothetical protein
MLKWNSPVLYLLFSVDVLFWATLTYIWYH